MIDQAGIRMAQGASITGERVTGVNDNMMKSHYHNYYELYYLEDGERYHMMEDHMYAMRPGELILFSPYVMHRSYGDDGIPFKELYFILKNKILFLKNFWLFLMATMACTDQIPKYARNFTLFWMS